MRQGPLGGEPYSWTGAPGVGRGSWGVTAGEGFDHHHGGTAARTATPIEGAGSNAGVIGIPVGDCQHRGWLGLQQSTGPCQMRHARGIGQQPIVADTVEAVYALQRIKGFMQSPWLCAVAESGAGPGSQSRLR